MRRFSSHVARLARSSHAPRLQFAACAAQTTPRPSTAASSSRTAATAASSSAAASAQERLFTDPPPQNLRPQARPLVDPQHARDTFFFSQLSADGDQEWPVSPWHDVPLVAAEAPGDAPTLHMIVEIPRMTREKFEMDTNHEWNPIVHELKDGAPRRLGYAPMPFNYGMLPQTWEDPDKVYAGADGARGDSDPLDVIELSPTRRECGSVLRVRVLGALGLVDEGEMDWKILAVDARHPDLDKLRSVDDIDRVFPGALDQVREYFTKYKTADGKAENTFLDQGVPRDVPGAFEVIQECHKDWKALLTQPKGDVWVPTAQQDAQGEDSVSKA